MIYYDRDKWLNRVASWEKLSPKEQEKRLGMGDLRKIEAEMPEPSKIIPNVNQEWAQKHPTLNKVLEVVSTPLRALSEVPWVQRAGQTGAEIQTMTEQPKVSTGSKFGDITADLWGSLMGFAANPAGGMNAGANIFNAGAMAAGKYIPAATSPILRTGAELGAGSALFEGVNSLVNERGFSPGEMGLAAGTNALLGMATHGIVRGLPELKTTAQKVEALDLTKPQPLLPPPKTEPLQLQRGISGLITDRATGSPFRQPGNVGQQALPMSAEESFVRSYGLPFTTQGRAQAKFYKTIDDLQQPLQDYITPPMPKKNRTIALADYVHEGMNGEIPLDEIRKLKYEDILDLAQEIAKGRKQDLWETVNTLAKKRDINLDDLYKTSTDSEYAKWKEFVGLSEQSPQPLQLKELTPQTGGELNAARNILKTTKNIDRAAKILETYPELKPEFRGLVNRIERSKAQQIKQPLKPKNEPLKQEAMPDVASSAENVKPLKQEEMPGMASSSENVKPSPREIDFDISITKNWVDRPKLLLKRETPERNFEAVMGKDAPVMINKFVTPVKAREAGRMRWLNKERSEIKSLGIKPRSKESKLTQQYGEGEITLDQLKEMAPKSWQKIKNAANVLRKKYDQYLDMINSALIRNGYEPIPKRKDYMRHFQDVTSLFEQYGIPKHKIDDLPTDINGLTADFRPGKNFFANALRRKGNKTTYDAITGIDGYLEGASRLIFHTDNIQRLRALENAIRKEYSGTNHLSNFVSELTEYTNILAGKKAMIDRAAEDLVGRAVYSTADWLRRRVGANMVGANISSALTQFIPVTQLAATTSKPAILKALKDIVDNVVKDDGFINKSDFLTRRIGSDPLSLNIFEKASNKASWLFKAIDNFASQLVVRSKYNEAIEKGLSPEQAMKQADDWASRLMADRSLGARPTLFNARSIGALTQFQLEVNNQLSFLLKDIPNSMTKIGAASAITQLFLYSYMFNNIFEKVAGYRPALDPIGVALRAYENYNNENIKTTKATENLIKDIANQLPFTSTFTGGRIPMGAAIPNVVSVATGRSKLGEEALKPLTYLAPPFGGGQAKKTVQGYNAASKGGVFTSDERLKFPINQDDKFKMLLFGPNSTKQALEYYRTGESPLGTKQTEKYRKLVNSGLSPDEAYQVILKERRKNQNK